ncbi:AraC family transcriptional regulator [Sinorhizobium fredii USDA 205]|uniref:Helix-turn-helix domain-containing protein n=2 Tax=Rhizobium fredii TaxID=380 RepID=A0A844A7X6_RHIFR|nr:helix-turn-helix domain-containing protein [Sinorhizobium fredii]KSV88751.1 AraC family transcriptional regulator [Sinorhizobium fredii USDA 205]MQW95390.1 helix-turn-helix domain-containing protein [Sinorhizobium fredii]MQX07072.1 helix-turn-helix domain-containing protein [Sinorhizobium fredii]MQX08431.1 helix-turn-helix domain-containing protein [Sinorhizobium fredii]UTY47172.1 helix-turn-helix domain-containing protein [Sinorhizobium fredii]
MRGDYSHLGPAKAPPPIDTPLRVAIVPTPNFTLMPLACFVDFLRLSGDESDYSRQIYCTWDVLSHSDEPVFSSCGIAIYPNKLYGDPSDYDYIIVHGGILHGNERPHPDLYKFVTSASRQAVPLVGSCSGSFVLAEAGLLSGKRCAVHFALAGTLRQNFPDVIPVTDTPVVSDGNVITSPGGLAAINLAMFLVADACGESRVHKAFHYLLGDRGFDKSKVTEELEIGLKCEDRRVANAIGLMRQKMYELCSISEIAAGVGTSERELSRLFNRHLQVTPSHYWRQMRLRAAKWMLLNSDRSIAQIAYECGFTDCAHFVHWFKRTYHVTPARMRRSHREFGLR